MLLGFVAKTACREIVGQGTKSATQSCNKEINTQNYCFGHCGVHGSTYVKCII